MIVYSATIATRPNQNLSEYSYERKSRNKKPPTYVK